MLTVDPTRLSVAKVARPAIGEFGFTDNRLQLGLNLRQLGAFRRRFHRAPAPALFLNAPLEQGRTKSFQLQPWPWLPRRGSY
jgi:hypothetical protein